MSDGIASLTIGAVLVRGPSELLNLETASLALFVLRRLRRADVTAMWLSDLARDVAVIANSSAIAANERVFSALQYGLEVDGAVLWAHVAEKGTGRDARRVSLQTKSLETVIRARLQPIRDDAAGLDLRAVEPDKFGQLLETLEKLIVAFNWRLTNP